MKCYMCDADATTREHVPPRSFFPKGHRENLVTVPSCIVHNHDQSLDIEYVRNIIVGFSGTNAHAEPVFEIAKRSFERSSALFRQTFGDFEIVHFEGEKTGVFKVDLERMKSVMRPIANAIHFKDYGDRYSAEWNVFVTSMKSREDFVGQPNQSQSFRTLLSTIQFVAKPVAQPNIFAYAVNEMADGLVFEFVFYGSFTIHCFGPRVRSGRISAPVG
jgi:hypothetical protein